MFRFSSKLSLVRNATGKPLAIGQPLVVLRYDGGAVTLLTTTQQDATRKIVAMCVETIGLGGHGRVVSATDDEIPDYTVVVD